MKRIFSLIRECGLSPAKEFLICLAFDAPFIAVIPLILLFNLQPIFIGYCIAALVFFDIFYFSRYGAIKKKNQSNLEDEFVSVFTYFGIYIANGYNVYQSLIAIKPFCSELLLIYLDELINEIDEDKSVNPYVKFGTKFNNNVSIKEVMLSIYQMVDEGGGENYIRQYESLFGKFSDERHKIALEKRRSFLQTLTILPLIGSGIIMIVLSISLVQIMGGYFSVL